MGAAAYHRGNAVISRGIQQDAKPQCSCGFVADHDARRVASKMEARIARAAAAFQRLQAVLSLERCRRAAILAAVDCVYQEAKAANADLSVLYWLTLVKVRAEGSNNL